jgi:hypothetical protein
MPQETCHQPQTIEKLVLGIKMICSVMKSGNNQIPSAINRRRVLMRQNLNSEI